MSSVVIAGDTSGTVTLQAPAVAGTTVLTLPTTSGTLVTTGGGSTGSFTTLTSTGASSFATGGGYVGIGTSSPTTSLQVIGKASAFPATSGTTQTGNALRLQPSDSNGLLDIGINAGNGAWIQSTNGTNLALNYALLLNPNGGNVGVGLTGPAFKLDVYGGASGVVANLQGIDAYNAETGLTFSSQRAKISGFLEGSGGTPGANMRFYTMPNDGSITERMRILSTGGIQTQVGIDINRIANTTSALNVGAVIRFAGGGSQYGMQFIPTNNSTIPIYFTNAAGGGVGQIETSASTTSYVTSSDYRLKENVAPMQNALETVAKLKPVTYTWKEDGSAGQGFIAHELQEVVPDCVTGEKDAIRIVNELDENGNKIGEKEEPAYQGIDTSFLVATLTAAIQELNAKVTSLEAKLAGAK